MSAGSPGAGPQVPRFFPVLVRRVTTEAEDLCRVEVDIGHTPAAGSHRRPGQYVELRLPGSTVVNFFAIASRPGSEDFFEFLIKTGEGLPDQICALHVGDMVEITQAQGRGYSLEGHDGKHILIFAMGTGIAPILSLLSTTVAEPRRYGSITLFYGARTPRHFAGSVELDGLARAGVQIRRIVSRPRPEDRWEGPVGHVQDLLEPEMLEPGPFAVFACGSGAMLESLQQKLAGMGHPAHRPGTNF